MNGYRGKLFSLPKQTRVSDNASIVGEDENGWKKGIERAMMENKKSTVVKLIIRCKKGGTSTVISDGEGEDLKKVCTF
jgi:hypothetical protein